MKAETVAQIKKQYELGCDIQVIADMNGLSYSSIKRVKLFDFDYAKMKEYYANHNKIQYLKRINSGVYDKKVIEDIPSWFTLVMAKYNDDEIKLAYNAFKNQLTMLNVVPCKCKGEFVCYPHQMENLRVNFKV